MSASVYCEKETDYKLMSEFEKVFGFPYNTTGGQELFDSKIPDGWFIFNFKDKKDLLIIENEKKCTLKKDGEKRLNTYYSLVKNKNQFNNIYLVLGI